MKLLKELTTVKEAATQSAGIIVVWPGGDGDVYDLVNDILAQFGYKDQGPVEDYEDELNARGVDLTMIDAVKDEAAVYYPTKIAGNKALLDALAEKIEHGKFFMYEQ
jgi:hypothetical protein